MQIAEVKRLRYGQTVYEKEAYNADGTARRWRVSGKVQTWKTDPNRIRVPIKFGMYTNGAIEAWNAKYFTTKEPVRRKSKKSKALHKR